MDQTTVQNILLLILTSIITGGFILVFVEIGNRKNRENDRYDQIMRPFMHKLSSYFRFLSWCAGYIKYPRKLNGYEEEFKELVKEIGRYGGGAIISGGDYSIDDFSADKLYNICSKINNIWYNHDRMRPCNLKWNNNFGHSEDYITKELKEFFPNLLSLTRDINLVSKVSGDFYTDIYQPIEDETYKHEIYVDMFKIQSIFVVVAVGFVLAVLVTMLFFTLPICVMQTIGILVVISLILCLLLLGMDMKTQTKYYNQFCKKIKEIRSRIKISIHG